MALIDNSGCYLFTQVGGFLQIGWNIEQGSFPQLRKLAFTPFIQRLVEAFPELTKTVQAQITSWQDFVLLDIFSSHCNSWGQRALSC